MPARPLTDEQKRQIAASTFMLTNPTVAASYKADPRVQLANALMTQGGNTDPVASGGWGIAEGLSRIGSGVAGGLFAKKERERYSAQNERLAGAEQAAMAAQLANAAEEQAAAVPQPTNPLASVAEALSGLPGGQPTPGNVSPSGGAPSPGAAPQMAPQASQMAPARVQQAAPPPNPTQAPAFGGRGAQSASFDPATLYRQAIVPIEGGTDANGRFLTSPKGAVGPGQVMPATAPEAAKLAGVPFNDFLYRNNAEYNNALGEAYFTAKLDEFNGDPIKAAAAYNAGAGRVRRAVRASQRSGQDWTTHLPAETQKYVENFSMRLNVPMDSGLPVDIEGFKETVPALPENETLPEAPAFGDRVRSRRLQIANAILGADNDLTATERATILAPYTTPEAFDEDTRAQMQRDENISQRDNIGYQQNLAASQARNTNVQEARIKASQDAAAYNRNLVLEQIRSQGRLGLEAVKGQSRVDAAAAKPQPDYWRKFYASAGGQSLRTDFQKGVDTARSQTTAARRARVLADRMNTGGLSYAGLAADARAKYDADVAELRSIANKITLDIMGGKLGAAISDADRNFVASTVELKPGTPPSLLRREALKYQALGARSQQYNEEMLSAFDSGDEQRFRNFSDLWSQYSQRVPVFDENGNVSPKSAITFRQWLEARERARTAQ
jgi:soluble lytic murein transglycosylase-like protein